MVPSKSQSVQEVNFQGNQGRGVTDARAAAAFAFTDLSENCTKKESRTTSRWQGIVISQKLLYLVVERLQ